MSEALIGCPFCGEKPGIEYDPTTGWAGIKGVYRICKNADCPCRPATRTFRTEADADAAWNTRAALAAAPRT
jgi:sarcosine oxidase delta subunit